MSECPVCGSLIQYEAVAGPCPSLSCDHHHNFTEWAGNYLTTMGVPNNYESLSYLIRNGIVRDLSDFYRVTPAQWKKSGLSVKEASVVQYQVAQSMKCTLGDFLFAIGAHGITKPAAVYLASQYHDIWDIAGLSKGELLINLNQENAHNTHTFFQRPDIMELLVELDAAGVETIQATPATGKVNNLRRKMIVFTGKLYMMTRHAAEVEAALVGAIPQKSVNGGTDILVCGQRVGDVKINAARAAGTDCITEDQWLIMLSDAKIAENI